MIHRLHARRRPGPGPAADTYLIVGLGNPGSRYARNRHNVGFMCVDHLAQEEGIAVQRKRFKALLGEGRIAGLRAVLLKPQTFMNDSGQAVAAAGRWYKVPAERTIVIYDDLDLPLGKVRLRPGGSSGGHRGIDSIIRELGTDDFVRVRIGIGRPAFGDPIDYVLGDFGPDQVPIIAETCARVALAVTHIMAEGIRPAMNTYNGL